MRPEIFTKRLEIRLTVKQQGMLKEVAENKHTTVSEAIRICIMECWMNQGGSYGSQSKTSRTR